MATITSSFRSISGRKVLRPAPSIQDPGTSAIYEGSQNVSSSLQSVADFSRSFKNLKEAPTSIYNDDSIINIHLGSLKIKKGDLVFRVNGKDRDENMCEFMNVDELNSFLRDQFKLNQELIDKHYEERTLQWKTGTDLPEQIKPLRDSTESGLSVESIKNLETYAIAENLYHLRFATIKQIKSRIAFVGVVITQESLFSDGKTRQDRDSVQTRGYVEEVDNQVWRADTDANGATLYLVIKRRYSPTNDRYEEFYVSSLVTTTSREESYSVNASHHEKSVYYKDRNKIPTLGYMIKVGTKVSHTMEVIEQHRKARKYTNTKIAPVKAASRTGYFSDRISVIITR